MTEQDIYIDVADLPPPYGSGLTHQLRNIPPGKALALTPAASERLNKQASRITATAGQMNMPERKYHTRMDREKGCVWVWWEARND